MVRYCPACLLPLLLFAVVVDFWVPTKNVQSAFVASIVFAHIVSLLAILRLLDAYGQRDLSRPLTSLRSKAVAQEIPRYTEGNLQESLRIPADKLALFGKV